MVEEKETWSGTRVRKTWIDFFTKRNHAFWPSATIVPFEDPTLTFINSGMCQFKPLFLGASDDNTELGKLKRACNSQKCIRAGGKHNDLEEVGVDTYHHTFFEMLGNWSFGDYFKKEAITWAWELLTKVYKLDPNRLYATYFEGDEEAGLKADLEAKELWGEFLPKERIIKGNKKDNFWEMGDTGPCGPCSELHYDRIGDENRTKDEPIALDLVNKDSPNVIEIWNLVFMQYNRLADKSLELLPDKHVDTGMGFERLLSILQNKPSNYDTDLFTPIFESIHKLANNGLEKEKYPKYGGLVGKDDVTGIDKTYRIIADHIRCLSIAIGDGCKPGNEGRHYVLKRILRRAARQGHEYLGLQVGFMSKLCSTVVESLGESFPNLKKNEKTIKQVLLQEEELFSKTLKKGLAKFKKIQKALTKKGIKKIPGQDVFLLYTSFGFPVDLTRVVAEENGMIVDEEEYEKKFEEFKIISGKQSENEEKEQDLELTPKILKELENIPETDDLPKYEWVEKLDAKVQAILDVDTWVNECKSDELIGIVLDKTSYYSKSGGQVADIGVISGKGYTFEVVNVKRKAKWTVHFGHLTSGSVKVGEVATCSVNFEVRGRIAPNHTCTHLLSYELLQVCGKETKQEGSEVDDKRFRFDFNTQKPLKAKKISKIEENINKKIQNGLKVYTKVCKLAEAKKICSLRTLENEAYVDPVRVISIGVPVEKLLADPTNEKWLDYSVEFCGGTHIAETGVAKKFCIISEQPKGSGIMRIEGCTGDIAVEAIRYGAELVSRAKKLQAEAKEGKDAEEGLASIRTELNLNTKKLPLVSKSELKPLTTALGKIVSKQALAKKKKLAQQATKEIQEAIKSQIEEQKLEKGAEIVKVFKFDSPYDGKALRGGATKALKKYKDYQVALFMCCVSGGKLVAQSAVSKKLSEKVNAKAWLDICLSKCGGRGGGKAQQAAGQGSQPEKIDLVVKTAQEFLKECNTNFKSLQFKRTNFKLQLKHIKEGNARRDEECKSLLKIYFDLEDDCNKIENIIAENHITKALNRVKDVDQIIKELYENRELLGILQKFRHRL